VAGESGHIGWLDEAVDDLPMCVLTLLMEAYRAAAVRTDAAGDGDRLSRGIDVLMLDEEDDDAVAAAEVDEMMVDVAEDVEVEEEDDTSCPELRALTSA
jgi:hypothetical protein